MSSSGVRATLSTMAPLRTTLRLVGMTKCGGFAIAAWTSGVMWPSMYSKARSGRWAPLTMWRFVRHAGAPVSGFTQSTSTPLPLSVSMKLKLWTATSTCSCWMSAECAPRLAEMAPTLGNRVRNARKPGSRFDSLPPFKRASSTMNAMPRLEFSAVRPTRPL